MPPARGVAPLAGAMMRAAGDVMHAARGMMRAGMVVMRAARAASRLPGVVTELPSGVSRLARGAVYMPAGVVPDPGWLPQKPARVTPLPSGVVPSPIRLPRFSFGAERFEQELQLGGTHIAQLRIFSERWISVASQNRLELPDERREERQNAGLKQLVEPLRSLGFSVLLDRSGDSFKYSAWLLWLTPPARR